MIRWMRSGDAAVHPLRRRAVTMSQSPSSATWVGRKFGWGQIKDTGGTGGMPINVGDKLIIQRETILGVEERGFFDLPGADR